MKTSTKTCPECKADVKDMVCECGYDFSHEPCPGCEKRIDVEVAVCPHCQYNLILGKPAKKKKEPKEASAPQPRATKQRKTEPAAESGEVRHVTRPVGGSVIFVPALGRMGGRSIDFAELHMKDDRKPEDVSDDDLLAWAVRLRDVWNVRVPDSKGYLSNHALGYLAQQADEKVLKHNSQRIVRLLGGDDW